MKNKLNLPPFYVGQKVVCVIACPKHGLFKDKTYTITKVNVCSCGHCLVAWGFAHNKTNPKLVCHKCGSIIPHLVEQYHASSEWFRPIQEQNFPLMTFSQIKETEKEEILIPN